MNILGVMKKKKGKILLSILIVTFEKGKIIAEKPNLNEFSSFKKQNEADIFLFTENLNIETYKQLEFLVSMSKLADRDDKQFISAVMNIRMSYCHKANYLSKSLQQRSYRNVGLQQLH